MITIYELIAPPEPPIGTAVIDRDGYVWERDEDGWTLVTGPIAAEDWFRLVRDYGPLRLMREAGNATPPRD